MQENVSLVCDTTEENVQAMFEHNPPIKQAFDTEWNNTAIQADALTRFSPEQHLKLLSKIYNAL